jgi:unsaturated chondroitin disaccharide hydrolase
MIDRGAIDDYWAIYEPHHNMPSTARAPYPAALDFAQKQVGALIIKHPDFFPIYTVGGKWHHGGELWTDWTGGFLAGIMWQFHLRERTEKRGQIAPDDPINSSAWRKQAEHYSKLLEHRQHDRNVHDLGFIFLSTYLPWYELTGEKHLHDVLVQAGRTLALRFMEKGQYLRSFVAPESLFIDIMMNVPIIFYAANETSDRELARIATAHCLTTRDVLVRDDGSTAHEGLFDLETGKFLKQTTHQGLADDSAWARGLAWSLYGYSKCYALTGNKDFLEVAERNAAYWLAHLPDDHVPLWDFDADPNKPPPFGKQKESSAAAIAASGLLDLARQTGDDNLAEQYEATALAMLDRLCTPEYLANATPGWEGILKHGVYHTAKNLGVDESVMWGEYFFVEALTKVVCSQFGRVSPESLERNAAKYQALVGK